MPRANSLTQPNLNHLKKTALRFQIRIEKKLSFIENYAGIYIPPRMARKSKRALTVIHRTLAHIQTLDLQNFH